MRDRAALLLLAALAACAGDGAGTAPNIQGSGKGSGTGGITGTIFTVTPAPDSQYLALQGVRVTLYRLGDLPGDSGGGDPPPPPPPGDTMLTVRQAALFPAAFLSDTTVPPPDSTPPPPPVNCTSGTPVASTTTNATGRYSKSGLTPGIYGLLVEPPAGANLSAREVCGVAVGSGAPAVVDIYLWSGPGPDPLQ